MRRGRSIFSKINQALFCVLRGIEQWYWHLSALPRRIVGWCFLISVVTLMGCGVYYAGKGVYRGGVAVYQWVTGFFSADEEPVIAIDPEAELESLDYYSGDYKHRQFPCGEINKKRHVNLNKDFGYINDVHLSAAHRLGITPVQSRMKLDLYKHKLVHLVETRYYKLDPMTQSVPYLVPDAADFLTALGQRWQQYHGTHSRFIVTSCTRTEEDVARLRRVNVNASADSPHRYGTTMDITYVRFDRRGKTWDGKLKEDLARALYDLQAAGHCYVKYEYKQSCFHITVRPRR